MSSIRRSSLISITLGLLTVIGGYLSFASLEEAAGQCLECPLEPCIRARRYGAGRPVLSLRWRLGPARFGNAITSASNLGTVGLDFQVAGFGPFHGPGTSDMMLRNVNTGQFELYDIVNNQITSAFNIGAVGLDFQLGGFAVDPPTGSLGSSDGSTSQLVQAMAGFGGDAADDSNDISLGADTSQQLFLTTPQT